MKNKQNNSTKTEKSESPDVEFVCSGCEALRMSFRIPTKKLTELEEKLLATGLISIGDTVIGWDEMTPENIKEAEKILAMNRENK